MQDKTLIIRLSLVADALNSFSTF